MKSFSSGRAGAAFCQVSTGLYRTIQRGTPGSPANGLQELTWPRTRVEPGGRHRGHTCCCGEVLAVQRRLICATRVFGRLAAGRCYCHRQEQQEQRVSTCMTTLISGGKARACSISHRHVRFLHCHRLGIRILPHQARSEIVLLQLRRSSSTWPFRRLDLSRFA